MGRKSLENGNEKNLIFILAAAAASEQVVFFPE
jgi:hypothetical protein